MTNPIPRKRVTARFADGAVISKRASVGVHKFAWQVTWLNPAHERERRQGFAYTQQSAQKMIDRVRRSLWGQITNVTAEIVWAIYEDGNINDRKKIEEAVLGTGRKRHIVCLYPPANPTPEQAVAFRKGSKHLIIAENRGFYTIKVLGEEHRVSKKTWCITGWPDAPGFTIDRRNKL